MVPFGGWAMPVEYADQGILKEHAATRTAAALYDVSHMGVIAVQGENAAAFLEQTLGRLSRRHRWRSSLAHGPLVVR